MDTLGAKNGRGGVGEGTRERERERERELGGGWEGEREREEIGEPYNVRESRRLTRFSTWNERRDEAIILITCTQMYNTTTLYVKNSIYKRCVTKD